MCSSNRHAEELHEQIACKTKTVMQDLSTENCSRKNTGLMM